MYDRSPVPLGASVSLGGAEEAGFSAPLSTEPASAPWRRVPHFALLAMGFLLPLSLLVLLAATYSEGGSARRHRAAPAQSPVRGSSPAPSETTAPFWVSISPKLVTVAPGSSVWLNCSSNCPLLESPILHTGLRRGQTLSGPNWVSFQLLDVRTWSSDVHCFVTCAGVTRGATARINAYSEGYGFGPCWGQGRGGQRWGS